MKFPVNAARKRVATAILVLCASSAALYSSTCSGADAAGAPSQALQSRRQTYIAQRETAGSNARWQATDILSHFPPYPSIWSWDWSGYMKAGGSIGRVYKRENGDFRFVVIRSNSRAANIDEQCCGADKNARLWDLFEQKFTAVSSAELAEFEIKFRSRVVDIWAVGRPEGAKLSDGTRIIRHLSIVAPKCYANFDEYYDAIDRNGRLVRSFYVVYVRRKPVEVHLAAGCPAPGEPALFLERVGSLRINLAPLDDGTALMWADLGTFVLRLDKTLSIKSSIGGRVFLIDAQALNKEFSELGPDFLSAQQRQDIVLRYLKRRKQP